MPQRSPSIPILAVAVFCLPFIAAKKPKPPDPTPDAQTAAEAPLPADLNQASMRIAALDCFYQLDLDPDQLGAIRSLAGADTESRAPVKANEKLTDLFSKMQTAILSDADDATIAALRNQIVDLINAGNIEMSDTIHPGPAAERAAATFAASLKASQIAAFIALHADEVADPVEQMNAALAGLREAKTGGESTEDQSSLIADTSAAVAELVVGADEAKAKPVADQVAAWLKKAQALSDTDFPAQQKSLNDEAHTIAAAPAMDILSHWLQQKMAVLLANPETPAAAQYMNTFRKAKTGG